eukprot:scaffold1204_cov179-Amphora_coffeaeformis.AAC.3
MMMRMQQQRKRRRAAVRAGVRACSSPVVFVIALNMLDPSGGRKVQMTFVYTAAVVITWWNSRTLPSLISGRMHKNVSSIHPSIPTWTNHSDETDH